jgi:hypothetical protein
MKKKTSKSIEFHRKPTKGEIKFGYGATFYRNFAPEDYLKKDGTIKQRIKAKNDGLIYTRSKY